MKRKITMEIFRGEGGEGELKPYDIELDEGMVLLDCVHKVQYEQEADLSSRWNCKAGKCGSCSAEINGKPRLMCMTRMSELPTDEPVVIEPMRAFPVIRDLVTDTSWNYRVKEKIKPFKPRAPDFPDGSWKMAQSDVERVQEFRKCIECFLCQNVCHVLRNHGRKDAFVGPRFMIRLASLDMHPLDTEDRIPATKDEFGSGFCNITRCCTDVCPEHIGITDNGIIPMKERVVDRYYDPVMKLFRMVTGK